MKKPICHPERKYFAKGLCKPCYMKEWHRAHPENMKVANQKYYKNNKEKISKQKKEYYEQNREEITENKRDYYRENREVVLKRNKEWKERNPEYRRSYHLQDTFGITLEDYDEILETQGGGCAICGKTQTQELEDTGRHLVVDHNHDTEKNRGILCGKCNLGLGLFEERVSSLQNTIDYIIKWE